MSEYDEQLVFEMGYNAGFKDGIKGSVPREQIKQMTTEIEDYLWSIPSDDVSLKVIDTISSIINKYTKEQNNE